MRKLHFGCCKIKISCYIKNSLETRVSQQEQQILSLKSKLLHHEVNNAKFSGNLELEALLEERGKEIQMIHNELGRRDELIEKQNHEINLLSNDLVSKVRTEVSVK